MEISQKLKILGMGSKHDACSCSPAHRFEKSNSERIGEGTGCAIYKSATPDGKPLNLFKVLYTNACSHDCRYCPNSTNCQKKPVMFEEEEFAKTFMTLYIRNYVEGVFLSSGIMKNADFVSEKMVSAIMLLRQKYKYRGYIHLKVLPGTSREMIKRAGELADRMSINIESPNPSRLKELSNIKDLKNDIIKRQAWINKLGLRGGHSTQLVVGAANETDLEILRTISWEYENIGLQKAYYSGFRPIKKTPLEFKDKTPLEREHRLYNSDFLMRTYKYEFREIKEIMHDGNLPKGDPKVNIAMQSFDRPIDINQAAYDELIRVPGIGPKSAMRILDLRKKHAKIRNYRELHNIGVVLKRAKQFVEVNGHRQKMLMEYS